MEKVTTKSFIEKAKLIHGNKYDYSKVEYVNNRTKVCIICPNHGEFWQKPLHHLQGHGCAKCYGNKKKTTEEFIEDAILKHEYTYDYSKVNYVNDKTKVCIICPKHGEFWQKPNGHLHGDGCPLCKNDKLSNLYKYNTNTFVDKANIMHNSFYIYDKTQYVSSKEAITITCPKHGDFRQTPNDHLSGHGCPICKSEKSSLLLSDTKDDFINKSKLTHLDKYTYPHVNYINSKTKVLITCPLHGDFWQLPCNHIQGNGCPKCSIQSSQPEEDIESLLSSLDIMQRNRTILNGKEIDIYIPSLKLGIEYNGLRWHSEEFGKDKHYHIDKLNKCNEQGINLIQIFEDEWLNRREICESKIKHICGLEINKPKIFARKCQVREIYNAEAKSFLDKNHIQGYASSTVYLGAFCNSQLVGVMTFKKEKEGFWDLNRFATDINYNCIGVGGKLFKYFIKTYQFIEIKSFADRRWTTNPTNNLYTKLGFEFAEFVRPDYRYFDGKTIERYHKFGFRKQILHKRYGLPLTMTEYEMTTELGYTRIWDCGLIKYVYKKKEDGI